MSRSYQPGDRHYVKRWASPYAWGQDQYIETMIAWAFLNAHKGEWNKMYWFLEAMEVGRISGDWPYWATL